LQSVIAQQEAANEERAAFAEEIQSSNEELQSINEELQTTKEELQAANEELTTINDELLLRNVELGQTNDDLMNLLGSVSIPIIMLGSDLRIRRFTPTAGKVMNFIPADVGRPISDIRPTLNVPDLEELILEAIETLSVKEREVRDWSGHWYFLRIRPYKTTENKIDGAVMTLVDTDAIKNSMEQVKEAREARNYAEAIVQTVRGPLVILDKDLRVKKANKSFYDAFKVSPEETENSLIYNLGNGQWNIPRLRELLQDILASETSFENFEVDHEFQDIGRKKMMLNARKIYSEDNQTKTILLAIETITEPGQLQRYA
jgi:two-component system, chemotaxis family, CheB/CheR fusion protein